MTDGPEPYVRQTRGKAGRRPPSRNWLWCLAAVGLALLAVAGLPRLGASLTPRVDPVRPSGWEYLGFAGEEIALLAVHEVHPVVLVVAGETLFCSVDGGRSWDELALPPAAGAATAVAVAHDPAAFLVGTAAGHVYRSGDGGQTWQPVALWQEQQPAAIIMMVDAALFARAGDGLWQSQDRGRTWTRFVSGNPVAASGNGGVIYQATAAGVARTTDGGQNWSQLDLAGVRALAAAGERLYLVTAADLLQLDSWGQPPRALLPEPTSVLVHPDDTALVYAGSEEGLWRSVDGGQTWTLYSQALGSAAPLRLALGLEGHTLFVATAADGLWRYSPAGPGGGPPP